ncbi:MAG: YceI family protein [Betaproteobacteria bacterium]
MSSRPRYVCAALRGLAFAWLAATVPASAATYRIDPKDTKAGFEVNFLGLFPIRGEFRRTTGMLIYEPASHQGHIEVFIDTTTLEASTEKARASARGPDFFDAEKFPSIDFRSSRFVFEENKLRAVEGSLTLVGRTRPVTLTVTSSGCVAAADAEPAYCRADAELMVKRSDFGMKAWAHTVGEQVTIRIAITARQAPETVKDPAKESPKEPLKEAPKSEQRIEPASEVPAQPVIQPSAASNRPAASAR